MALLQHCAAATGSNLILYTNDKPYLTRDLHNPAFALTHNFSATPTLICGNPIDLDLWLELNAGFAHGKQFTHHAFILAVGNTVAAHVDRDMHPIVVAVNSLSSSINPLNQVQDALRAYILDLSVCINVLARAVLAHAGAARQ